MKHIEIPSKKHFGGLINDLGSGKFIIPNFQREFEWNPWDVVELLKSIFEDYYIGTLLLWKANKENQELLACEKIYGFSEKGEPLHIVLDGQQRLSALYYAIFAPSKVYPRRKNRCFFFINIESLLNENYDNLFFYEWESRSINKLIEDKQMQFEKQIFPLKILGQSPYEWYKWIEEYEKYWSLKTSNESATERKNKLEIIFKELLDSYEISYIELDKELEVEKVCDIFTRINNTGIPLTIFDLLNALLTPKNIQLKEMWRGLAELSEFKGFDENKMKVYILQTMSILKQNYCSPKYLYYLVPEKQKLIKLSDGRNDKITLIPTKDDFTNLWNLVVKNLIETVRKIENPRDYGAITPDIMPYPSMIPIMTASYMYKQNNPEISGIEIQDKIARLYWSSIFTKSYSSSAESQMAKDYVEIQNWIRDDSKVPDSVEQCITEIQSIDLKNETSQNSAIYKAIFNMLIRKGAKDWITLDFPEYSKLDDHHIVPQSWGKKNSIKSINSILNMTPLSNKTNREIIGSKLPNEYLINILKRFQNKDDFYALFESHLISRKAIEILMREDFNKEDFEEFLDERRKTIISDILLLLGIDEKDFLGLIAPQTPFTNKLQITRIITKTDHYLYWVDKYFSKIGFEVIIDALNSSQKPTISEIKIITSKDRASSELRNYFKDFRDELEHKNIKAQMHVLIDKNIYSEIHDRWLLSEYKNYNLPSTDTLLRGQYSEIKETINKPPFDDWWSNSLDIIQDWDRIHQLIEK